MPVLTWNGKALGSPQPATLRLDSLVNASSAEIREVIPENKFFEGDNLAIMAALLPEYAGRVNLIYVDPPFFTNRQFTARIGRGEDSRKPQEWQLATGYADQWDSLDAYINFLYQRLALMVGLLAPGGTIYIHLDWHADAYARLLLDELLGAENFLNEIIWTYHGPSPIRSAFNRKHDTILVYTKGAGHTFNADAVRIPYNDSTVKTFSASKKAGFGKIPDLERGKVPEDWWYFPVVARLHSERTGYPTQKPEILLERIILASSNPGDIVADFFCGSGTTPLVAARHGRRFLAVDATFRAIHTAKERQIRSHNLPFAIFRNSLPTDQAKIAFPYTFALSSNTIQLTSEAVPIFWEVDADWNGTVFRSTAQAVLPLRSGEISRSLPLLDADHPRQICVRVVTAAGEQVERCINEQS